MSTKIKQEVVLIQYYNVLFYLVFKKEVEDYKRTLLLDRVDAGEQMNMKIIYEWCLQHQIPVFLKFIYRKDFPLKANLWNLYSYLRFKIEIRI